MCGCYSKVHVGLGTGLILGGAYVISQTPESEGALFAPRSEPFIGIGAISAGIWALLPAFSDSPEHGARSWYEYTRIARAKRESRRGEILERERDRELLALRRRERRHKAREAGEAGEVRADAGEEEARDQDLLFRASINRRRGIGWGMFVGGMVVEFIEDRSRDDGESPGALADVAGITAAVGAGILVHNYWRESRARKRPSAARRGRRHVILRMPLGRGRALARVGQCGVGR
jgi:hypothetical protein